MADFRSGLKEAYDRLDESDRDELQALSMQLWRDALSAEKKTWGFCPGCGKKVQVDYPDTLSRVKALEILANQQSGPPVQTVVHNLGERTIEAFERMSMAELAQFIGAEGGEIVDAEILELGVGDE